jgi:L-serine dehydratase
MADYVGVFSIFKVGVGPSSSHTVGPMRAAGIFVDDLVATGVLARVVGLNIRLYGSLSATGRGHGTDTAIVLGLAGERPETLDPDVVPHVLARVAETGRVALAGHLVSFVQGQDLHFERSRLPLHPNGVRFVAFDASGDPVCDRTYFSVGGGFVANGDGRVISPLAPAGATAPIPHPFDSGDALLARCRATGLSVSTLMLENERALRPEAEVRRDILAIADVMAACVERGCAREGLLPGRLGVRRRAALMHRRLIASGQPSFLGPTAGQVAAPAGADPLAVLDWVSLFALAVNEENAAGGRVVTAPTNGAAGIVPAVLLYFERFVLGGGRTPQRAVRDDGVVRFLLTAAAIGSLYQRNASISGAEVGCQGEVGVACSMAAAGLAEVMGGSPAQVENAAEIGMEHNLGLTCDPIGGLVQVPCIERNAMGAIKAINAARLAMSGDGQHQVSLDKVIATMRDTGRDMSAKYKETSEGGLAVNITEC